jgi:hypothetical protein
MRGDQKIVGADDLATRFEGVAGIGVDAIDARLERINLDAREHLVHAIGQHTGAFLLGIVAQFTGDDDAGEDLRLAGGRKAHRDGSAWIAGQRREHIGVEQQSSGHALTGSTGSGGRSSVSGQSVSIGSQLGSSRPNHGRCVGSMISRCPSR